MRQKSTRLHAPSDNSRHRASTTVLNLATDDSLLSGPYTFIKCGIIATSALCEASTRQRWLALRRKARIFCCIRACYGAKEEKKKKKKKTSLVWVIPPERGKHGLGVVFYHHKEGKLIRFLFSDLTILGLIHIAFLGAGRGLSPVRVGSRWRAEI